MDNVVATIGRLQRESVAVIIIGIERISEVQNGPLILNLFNLFGNPVTAGRIFDNDKRGDHGPAGAKSDLCIDPGLSAP